MAAIFKVVTLKNVSPVSSRDKNVPSSCVPASALICTGTECFPKVTLHNFCHQSICRASHGYNLLQQGGAIGPGFDRAFQSVRLALDTPQACDGSFLVLW